ncbi:MAG TPA: hypothetical protein VHA10_24325 [Hypericibacter adhaerens]|jgi:hypothetical protein|uniref:hypothetical protein n=1 Tax=Hypericibacter adhaerens TaxID=2602016 RepID=UPI002C857944|nr:hypothetical protein [Hypericibacter adhaerens]HWA46367.1 hypothetical protein [Hypericibacter adhaerens]
MDRIANVAFLQLPFDASISSLTAPGRSSPEERENIRGRSALMTDHGPVLLPALPVLPKEQGPAAAPPPAPGRGPTASRPHRSALWLAASGRWMNRSFDPAEAEAIRDSYRKVSAPDPDEAA